MYLEQKIFNNAVIKDNGELPPKGNIFLSGYTSESYKSQVGYKQELDRRGKLCGLKFGGFMESKTPNKLPQFKDEEPIELLANYAVPELVKIAKEYRIQETDLSDSERLEALNAINNSKK